MAAGSTTSQTLNLLRIDGFSIIVGVSDAVEKFRCNVIELYRTTDKGNVADTVNDDRGWNPARRTGTIQSFASRLAREVKRLIVQIRDVSGQPASKLFWASSAVRARS